MNRITFPELCIILMCIKKEMGKAIESENLGGSLLCSGKINNNKHNVRKLILKKKNKFCAMLS